MSGDSDADLVGGLVERCPMVLRVFGAMVSRVFGAMVSRVFGPDRRRDLFQRGPLSPVTRCRWFGLSAALSGWFDRPVAARLGSFDRRPGPALSRTAPWPGAISDSLSGPPR